MTLLIESMKLILAVGFYIGKCNIGIKLIQCYANDMYKWLNESLVGSVKLHLYSEDTEIVKELIRSEFEDIYE